MKFTLERPGGGELDLELIWLLVLAAIGIVGVAWLCLPLPTPTCAFHEVTGLPCPSCGGTRCARSLLAGHFSDAFAWNPLVFLLAFVTAIYGLYASAAVFLRLPRIRLRAVSQLGGNALRIGIFLIVGANWFYLVHHFAQLPAGSIRKTGLTSSWVAQ